MDSNKTQTTIGVLESSLILLLILGILGYEIIGLQQSPQIPLLLSVIILMFYGRIRHFSWTQITAGIERGIKPGITPLFIFLLIGVLVATWIFSGTIPTVMYFGFQIVSNRFFLPEVFIVCSLVALVCGSSFTTISTMGLVFTAIGVVLKINLGLVAGAIVSGAFFGANISPLSGTTNLAAAIGEIDLYQHLKSLLLTDIPAWFLTCLLYLIINWKLPLTATINLQIMMQALRNGFWISGVAMIPILLLLILALCQVPSVPSLALGAFSALIIGWWHHPTITISKLNNYLINGYSANTGNHLMDSLLSKGGINSMLSSLALIIFALALGGLLIEFNIINILVVKLQHWTQGQWRLSLVTVLTCLGVNFLIGEQYLSIILPGEAFKDSFDKQHFPRYYLTRLLNDAGSAVNSLVPWSVSGVFIATTLNMKPAFYLPYCFFPILVLILTTLSSFFKSILAKNY